MKKLHFIAPLVLLAVFLIYERDYSRARTAKLAHAAVEVAATRAVAATRLAEHRQIAAAEVLARNAARETDERERADQKRLAQAAALQAVALLTAEHAATRDAIGVSSAALEQQLTTLRAHQTTLDREATELRRKLDVRRAARRATELELQESTERLALQLHAQVDAIGPVSGRE